jgi:hypothetical protein
MAQSWGVVVWVVDSDDGFELARSQVRAVEGSGEKKRGQRTRQSVHDVLICHGRGEKRST